MNEEPDPTARRRRRHTFDTANLTEASQHVDMPSGYMCRLLDVIH